MSTISQKPNPVFTGSKQAGHIAADLDVVSISRPKDATGYSSCFAIRDGLLADPSGCLNCLMPLDLRNFGNRN